MNNKKYLIEEHPWKGILKFTIPLFGATAIQQVYSIVDAIIAGRFIGVNALASVGANSPIIQLAATLFFGLSIGANILISQNYGAGNKDAIRNVIDTFMIMAYVSSFLFFIFVFLLAEPIHKYLLITPNEILPSSIKYMNTILIGIIALFGYSGISASLRATGDTKTPLVLLVISNIINLLLNILFVVVFDLNIVGLALATTISQILVFVLGIVIINTRNEIIKIHFFNSKFKIDVLKDLISIGLPAAIQATFMSIGAFAIQALINRFGVVIVAGYNIAMRLEIIILAISMNFGQALSVFIAQNIGANKFDRIKYGVNFTLAISMAVSIVLGIIMFVFCEYILLLFTSDKDVIDQSVRYLKTVAPFYMAATFTYVLSGGIRGSGATLVPMIVSAIGQVILRIPLAYIFVYIFKSVDGVWFAIPMSWLSGSILIWIYYKSNKWKNHIRVNKPVAEIKT